MKQAVLILGAFSMLVSCDPARGPSCDEASLVAALDASLPGESVRVGACRIEARAPLVVPAGVTLVGAGPSSVLASRGLDGPLVVLGAASGTTRVADLAIDHDGTGAAIHAPAHGGAIVIERVTVTATRGMGIALRGRDTATLTDVEVTGPVTEVVAAGLPPDPTVTETATHGLVLVDVGSTEMPARLTNVRVSRFGGRGVMFVDGIIVWVGGEVAENAGVALQVAGGSVELEGVCVRDTRAIGAGLVPPFSMAVASGAELTGTALEVADGAGYGIVLFDASATLVDLTVTDQALVGVWAQRALTLEVMGTASVIARNGAAGIAALGVGSFSIGGASVEDTRAIPRVVAGGVVMVGDGIHVAAGTTMHLVDGIRVSGNERVGLLFDANGGTLEGTITGVMIDGSGAELGAIAQNGTIAGDWDSGITRTATVEANDSAFAGTLDVMGASLEPPSLAAVDGI